MCVSCVWCVTKVELNLPARISATASAHQADRVHALATKMGASTRLEGEKRKLRVRKVPASQTNVALDR
jgi:hypothetical protein